MKQVILRVFLISNNPLLLENRTQGGCVSSIKPEYLMEPQDYKVWMHLQCHLEAERNKSGHRDGTRLKTEEEETIEDQLFEAVSKRAWTDVLLQLLKVCLTGIYMILNI